MTKLIKIGIGSFKKFNQKEISEILQQHNIIVKYIDTIGISHIYEIISDTSNRHHVIEFLKETWVREHSKPLTHDQFFGMYPELRSEKDDFPWK